MKRFNKFLALFLAVVLTVGLMPAAVSAASNDVLATSFEDITLPNTFTGVGKLVHEAYWDAGAGTIISTDAKTGTHSVKLTPSEHSNKSAFKTEANPKGWLDPSRIYGLSRLAIDIPTSNFEAGKTYVAGAWFKTNRTGIKININVQDKNYLSNGQNIDTSWLDVGTEWTYKEVVFTAKADAGDYTKFRFGSSDYTANTDDYVLVDDIRIYKVVPYGYETVVEELEAGNATLQTDVDGTGNDLIVKTGKTLDLAGYTLTVDSLSAMPGAKVIDSVGTGKIVVANDNLTLQADNGMIPIKTNAGYVLSNVKLTNNELEDDGLDDIMVYETRPSLGAANNAAYLVDGAADNGLSIIIRLTWTNESNGTTTTMDVPCSDEVIKDIYAVGSSQAIRLLVKGVDSVENLKVATVVTSTTGVTCVSDFCDYVAPVA